MYRLAAELQRDRSEAPVRFNTPELALTPTGAKTVFSTLVPTSKSFKEPNISKIVGDPRVAEYDSPASLLNTST